VINKKGLTFIAILAVVLILGWFVYRALNRNETEVINDSNPKVHTLDVNTPPSLKVSDVPAKVPTQQHAEKVDENEARNFEIYDRLEKEWLEKVQTIIGAEKYPRYLEMRETSEKEKLLAYKEYHDYLRQKYGDKFSYNISEDQSVREKQINERYLNDLLKIIGPEKFKSYTEAKDRFNEDMRRKKTEAIQIEF
jgi:hypothetical protein